MVCANAQRSYYPALQREVVLLRKGAIDTAAANEVRVHLAEGKREQRERARHLHHLVGEAVNEFRGLEAQHPDPCRALDDAPKLVMCHLRHNEARRCPAWTEDRAGELGLKLRADGKEYAQGCILV